MKKKKFRQTHGLFLAEGIKVVEELINSNISIHQLYATEAYANPYKLEDIQLISEKELKLLSEFSNPNQIFGVFEIPEPMETLRQGLTLVLDEINDPGNLGTIIRLCDWFGADQLICSENTVDCFNHKVVQASMGSLSRVSIKYLDLKEYLEEESRTIYGTFLNGENVYANSLDEEAVVIFGNEANGISADIEQFVTKKITIPQFGKQLATESLNVAMSVAILLSECKR